MDCLRESCKYFSIEKSNKAKCTFCTIAQTCILGSCPITPMTRYAEDWLEGLRQIRKYLDEAKGS